MEHQTPSSQNRDIRFMGIFTPAPPLPVYIMQAVVFAYGLWRFMSRDYTVYGFLPDHMFNFPRHFNYELWPVPLLHVSTFQFIYQVIPRPTPEVIAALQWAICIACTVGLIGMVPKGMAWLAFLLSAHLTGFAQASNADIDGGTLFLMAMLILALSPSHNFYGIKNGFSLGRRSVHYQRPIFLLLTCDSV